MTTYWLFVFNDFLISEDMLFAVDADFGRHSGHKIKGVQLQLHAGQSLIKHLTAFVTKAISQSLTVQDVQQASMRKIPTCDIDKEEKCSGKAPHRDQPSPCHQPQPLTPAPKLSQLSQAPADSRWVRIPRAPPGPEVLLVLLGVADYRGGAARKASAVAWWWWWTHSPPLLPGERWQLANTALYICSKHPFQALPGCKKAFFKEIQTQEPTSHPARRKQWEGGFLGPFFIKYSKEVFFGIMCDQIFNPPHNQKIKMNR